MKHNAHKRFWTILPASECLSSAMSCWTNMSGGGSAASRPEAPVMVVDAERHTFVPGGAANVVNNLCALGAKAAIAGRGRRGSAGQTLTEKLVEEGADVAALIATQDRPTTLKTRIIAHSQQVVRVDHEKRDAIERRRRGSGCGPVWKRRSRSATRCCCRIIRKGCWGWKW